MASTINSSSISTTTLNASTVGTFPAGHIIQTVQQTDTDNTTFDVGPGSKTNTPFDNLNCSITPL